MVEAQLLKLERGTSMILCAAARASSAVSSFRSISDAESSTTEAANQLAESFTDIVELRFARDQGVTLVRPDAYIAYSAHSRDGIAALASVRSLLERQTNSAKAI